MLCISDKFFVLPAAVSLCMHSFYEAANHAHKEVLLENLSKRHRAFQHMFCLQEQPYAPKQRDEISKHILYTNSEKGWGNFHQASQTYHQLQGGWQAFAWLVANNQTCLGCLRRHLDSIVV